MLDLEFQVSEIINNDKWLREEIDNKWINIYNPNYPERVQHTPEWYAEIDFVDSQQEPLPLGMETQAFRIYADALREFGVMVFTGDLMTGRLYLEWTHQTVKLLVEQYGLRNVTNEFSRQIAERYRQEDIKR